MLKFELDTNSGKSQRIGAQVYEHLRREILEMRLLPRTSLSEAEIAIALGVSRTPAREALIRLSEEGLVKVYPQAGTIVAPISIAEVMTAQFVREALECAAISLAAKRITDEQILKLRGLLGRQDAYRQSGEPELFFKADEDFHQALMTVAGHATAWSIVANAKAQLDRVRRVAMRAPLKLDAILAEHRAILDAVIARDARKAEAQLRSHVRGIFQTVERTFEENRGLFDDGAISDLKFGRGHVRRRR